MRPGALLRREVMERLSYSDPIGKHLTDPRVPGQVIHSHSERVRLADALRRAGAAGGAHGTGAHVRQDLRLDPWCRTASRFPSSPILEAG